MWSVLQPPDKSLGSEKSMGKNCVTFSHGVITFLMHINSINIAWRLHQQKSHLPVLSGIVIAQIMRRPGFLTFHRLRKLLNCYKYEPFLMEKKGCFRGRIKFWENLDYGEREDCNGEELSGSRTRSYQRHISFLRESLETFALGGSAYCSIFESRWEGLICIWSVVAL